MQKSAKSLMKLHEKIGLPKGKEKGSASSGNKKSSRNPLDSFIKGLAIYVLIGLAALIFVMGIFNGNTSSNSQQLGQVVSAVKNHKVQKIEVDGDQITATYKDGTVVTTQKEPGTSIYDILKDSNIDPTSVSIDIKNSSDWQQIGLSLMGTLLPVLLMVGLFFLVFRQAKDAGQGIFSFGQSKARLFTKDAPQVKFNDVAGVGEAKRELQEVVEFLKTPEKFRALGARIPKGVLLVGPAGVGKTLLARAVAGEANVPFFSIAGSEFMEMLVGVGAARVRDMFAQAKKSAPAIIFIDEIESIGRMRGMGFSGGHDEREQTLNQILVEMDGFSPTDHVIVIGATNRPDMLDPALVRPGRFDRRVTLGLPDLEERKAIITLHMKGKPFAKDVSIDKIARRTISFSGADIANMLNEAAIMAARDNRTEITYADIEEAATKEKLGPKRQRMASEKDRKLAAYHEAGHAIAAHYSAEMDPVHGISIVARGMSGGHTLYPPSEDRSNETKGRLLAMLTSAMGGRAAEEVIFKDISTGASSDIKVATDIARDMVTQYGMSELGPINLKSAAMFGQWQNSEESVDVSPELRNSVDKEVKKIIDNAYKNAVDIIKKHKEKLDKVAAVLLDKENIDGEEFEKIVGKKPEIALA